MNRKCPECNGNMTLDVITNTWVCSDCDSQFEDEEFEETETEIDEEMDNNDNKITGDYTINHCSNCNFSFIGDNIDKCFICNSSLNKEKTDIDYSKFIDFNLNIGDAIHNYKKHLKFRLLVPYNFRKKRTLKRIMGVYVPMYLYDAQADGDVVFNASDVNVLDTSKKEKNITYFKVVCNGHFDFENVLINGSTKINNTILEKIDNFDYSKLKEFNEFSLVDKTIYKEDCDDENIFDRLKNRCINSSVKLMNELVNHSKSKVVDNQLDFKHEKKGIILVPVYFLINKYRNKDYYYIMNAQNGNTYIKTPIGIIETIIFGLLIFTISFAIMMLVAFFL